MGSERDLGIYIGNRLNEQEVKNTSVQKRGAVTTSETLNGSLKDSTSMM